MFRHNANLTLSPSLTRHSTSPSLSSSFPLMVVFLSLSISISLPCCSLVLTYHFACILTLGHPSSSVGILDTLWRARAPTISPWLSSGLAVNTRRTYQRGISEWETFAASHSLVTLDLFTRTTYESSRQALVLFINHLQADIHMSSSQIKSVLMGLRHELVTSLHDVSSFDDESVRLARRATREPARLLHQRKRAHTRMAVTFDILEYLEKTLHAKNHVDSDMTYLGALLGFNFMLRGCEYMYDSRAPHALLCGDTTFRTVDHHNYNPLELSSLPNPYATIHQAVFDLNSSKADQSGKGRYLYVSRDQGPSDAHILDTAISFCLRANHRSLSDPLLSRYLKGRAKRLHRGMVNDALKEAALHFGFDSLYFSTHSLRIGGATCGAAAGRSDDTLSRIAGWSEKTSGSSRLYQHTTPQDAGILSARDQGSYLLSTHDLRAMMPTFSARPSLR